jgi:hypothetical protein
MKGAIAMSPEPARARPRTRRFGVDFEEERTWVTFYRRVGHDVALAGEVLSQLEADPEMKRDHLALYLCCKESLYSDKIRQARNKRIGQFVRWLCHGLFMRPALALRRGLHRSGNLAVQCLPVTAREPALPRVRQFPRQAEVAQAHSDLDELMASAVTPNGAAGPGAASSSSSRAKASSKAA